MAQVQEVVISTFSVPYPEKAILRRLGFSKSVPPPPSVIPIMEEEKARASGLVQPKSVHITLEIRENLEEETTFEGPGFVIRSRQVSRLLRKAEKATLFMVTIGKDLENKVREWTEQGELTRAYLLDTIGSEITDEVAQIFHREVMSRTAAVERYRLTARFSPGYGDWPLTVQKSLFDLCRGERIGLSINDANFLIPRKSVSAVFGWINRER